VGEDAFATNYSGLGGEGFDQGLVARLYRQIPEDIQANGPGLVLRQAVYQVRQHLVWHGVGAQGLNIRFINADDQQAIVGGLRGPPEQQPIQTAPL
jgi:hypothetical protein